MHMVFTTEKFLEVIEPTTTEFRSESLTDWAIRQWAQLELIVEYIYICINSPVILESFFYAEPWSPDQ